MKVIFRNPVANDQIDGVRSVYGSSGNLCNRIAIRWDRISTYRIRINENRDEIKSELAHECELLLRQVVIPDTVCQIGSGERSIHRLNPSDRIEFVIGQIVFRSNISNPDAESI
jgi:hypothetical protein